MVYCQIAGKGYEAPDTKLQGRNSLRAFHVGFYSYFWTLDQAVRTAAIGQVRAARRYRHGGLRECYELGWNAAMNMENTDVL